MNRPYLRGWIEDPEKERDNLYSDIQLKSDFLFFLPDLIWDDMMKKP